MGHYPIFNLSVDANMNSGGLTFPTGTSSIDFEKIKGKSDITIPYQLTAPSIATPGYYYIGKIDMSGDFVYFEPKSDVHHNRMTRAEIPVCLRVTGCSAPSGGPGGYFGSGGGGGGGGGGYSYSPPSIYIPDQPIPPQPLPVETVHERVKLSLSQRATLERDAFAASLELTNKLTDTDITDLNVTLKVSNGTDSASDYFFVNLTGMNNIKSITSGTILPSAIANIDWILIPTADAGGKDEAGVPYYVEAFIRYSVNGVQYRINSTQEKIMVMPQPNLCLNYYIPEKVKAYTPFKLALEVNNTGYGTARNFQIESAQPVIYENLAELLIDFKLLGSTMMGENVTPSLKINFGNIPPGTTKLGYWTMATTLDGNFTEFNASYTHSDALGGAKTSLISCVKTNILTHDVNTGSVTNDFLYPLHKPW